MGTCSHPLTRIVEPVSSLVETQACGPSENPEHKNEELLRGYADFLPHLVTLMSLRTNNTVVWLAETDPLDIEAAMWLCSNTK